MTLLYLLARAVARRDRIEIQRLSLAVPESAELAADAASGIQRVNAEGILVDAYRG